MQNANRLAQIRENERQSHTAIYSSQSLYAEGSWLGKPVRTVLELLPCFQDHRTLHVLDLGCGVGRNSIAVAQHFRDIPCLIDCVDILELAIEKLNENAQRLDISSGIHGVVMPIEDFPIPEDAYDLVLAVSALEHVDSNESFIRKLLEIRDGIRKNGIVCLVVNSNVTEHDKLTGVDLPAQFEVNLPTGELQALLDQTFTGWKVLKSGVQEQRYDIPRGDRVSALQTHVVTFVARNGG